MAPLELDGNTLADKRRNYNKFFKEAIASNKTLNTGEDLNTGENDIENLLKIDVASCQKDVDYILTVLRCEDMLYVSRAIKKCKWLITDRQYSHIINPSYLHSKLFPQMMSKATAKLLLHIRLNLKHEDRIEDFYNYYKEKDIKTALRWLPLCSLSLIEQEVEKNADEITGKKLKRLCEKSITILEKIISKNGYGRRNSLQATMFLINTNTEKYLDIVENIYRYDRPSFGPKYTDKIMKICPDRVKNNFEKYAEHIDTKTFAKHIKKEELKDFLKKQSENKQLHNWFTYNNLKHFIYHLPKEGRFEFLKSFLIEKQRNRGSDIVTPFNSDIEYCAALISEKCGDCLPNSSSANIYLWYRFASFDVAFADLIKLIRTESNPTERLAMFGVLLSCAGRNVQHVQTLLQYYHDKHINEPFKFKIQFVNMILTKTKSHKFDETTWNILNNIFRSMEVYSESANNVQSCIEAIIVYSLLHDQPIPEIIEKKFSFSSLKSISKKLNCVEADKVLDYLYKSLVTKIENINITSEHEFQEVAILVDVMETLLKDWNKNFSDFPWMHNKIKQLIVLKKNTSWKTSLACLYNNNRSWKRLMFQESIALSPSEETCYNALKHDPGLLSHYASEIAELRRDDNVSLRKLLCTLRVHWPQSLAAQWAASYLSQLDKLGGHKALIQGLCFLTPQTRVIELVKKYAPTESKINWSEEDELDLSLRKHLARNMHLSRPPPPLDVVLLYTKGDYLQFVLPSLNAVLHNMSPERTGGVIPQFLNAPVSLQKHGIRNAFSKLDSEKLKKLFSDIWKVTKNASIRTVIFQQTFELLCREKKSMLLEEIWELLSVFIDNLSNDENKIIYETLSKVDNVPLIVKGKFFMKSYKCLKALPTKANCDGIVNDLEWKIKDIMEHLDPDFVADLIMTTTDKKFTTERYNRTDMIAAFLLCAKDVDAQMERFNKVLLPILERSFALWDIKIDGYYCVSVNVNYILEELSRYLQRFVFDLEMVFPTKLFTEIMKQLEERLVINSNYRTVTSWKLLTTYVKLLEEHKSCIKPVNESSPPKDKSYYYNPDTETKWNEVFKKAIPQFAAACVGYLKEDVEKYFPSIFVMFSDALDWCFNHINRIVYLECLLSILEIDPSVHTYLMVLKSIPIYISEDDERKKVKEIREIIFSHPSTEIKFHYYLKYKRHDLENV